MKHFYEHYLSCKGVWADSSIVMNARQRAGTRRKGRYVWVKFDDLVIMRPGSVLWGYLGQGSRALFLVKHRDSSRGFPRLGASEYSLPTS